MCIRDSLQIALDAVLDVRGGEVTWVHQVAFDKAAGDAGALLQLAQHQELAHAKGIAALDAVDHESVGTILADVALQQFNTRWQAEIGVTAHAILGQRLQRSLGIVAEAAVVQTSNLGIAAGYYHRAFVVEHLPELAEAS